MSKVSCRSCGHMFTVVGIVRRNENCFCSTRCLVEHLNARLDSNNAVSIEYFPKVQEVQMFPHQSFRGPGLIGILGH